MSPATSFARDKTAILRTVDRYATGLRGHIKQLERAFRPRAIVFGYIGKTPYFDSISQLRDYVRQHASPREKFDPFRYRVTSLKVSGQTATVQLNETAYLDVDYETSLQLMKIKGKWLIVSKLFSGRPLPKL